MTARPPVVPVLVIEEPADRRDGPRRFIEYTCRMSDGSMAILSQKDMAKALNCVPSTLWYRVQQYGYNSPRVCQPGHGKRPDDGKSYGGRPKKHRYPTERVPRACNWRAVEFSWDRCPATAGIQITMTIAGWTAVCSKMRKKMAKAEGDLRATFCRKCQGKKVPPEVTLVRRTEQV